MNKLPAIDRYIARLIFFPMLGTLVLSAMLLVLEKMLRLFDFVATEGGPVSVVWRMLANLIPEYLSLGIPIGLIPARRAGRPNGACPALESTTY